MFNCIVRNKFNKNSGSYHYYNNYNSNNRYQGPSHWNANVHYTPQWRWTHEPHDSWNTTYNKSQKSKDDNRHRQHSDEPAPKRPATSGNASRHPSAESAQPSDALTNKLTERTSTIISNVLSGKDNADAKNRAKTTTVQSDRSSSTGHAPSTSHAGSNGQSKRPGWLPQDKPKNTGGGSEKLPETSRQIGSTSSSHVNRENVAAASKVPPTKSSAPSSSDLLLSPTSSASRAGHDVQASLVRMATAPRSRREQLELERMLHEHAKKSTATKDRLHELQPASGTGTSSATNGTQNVPQPHPADVGRPSEQARSSAANNARVIDAATGNMSTTSVQENRPSSSGTVQSEAGSTTGPGKAAKKPRVSKKKPRTQKVPKAKVLAPKTARAKVAKRPAPRKSRKVQNFGRQGLGNSSPFISSGNSRVARPLQPQIMSLSDLNILTDLGSCGLSPSLVPGLVGMGSQRMSVSPANRAASSLSATPSSLQVPERGPLDTLLEMSLHEEDLCSKLNQLSSEIEQLQNVMAKLDEELKKRELLKANVSLFCIIFLK